MGETQPSKDRADEDSTTPTRIHLAGRSHEPAGARLAVRQYFPGTRQQSRLPCQRVSEHFRDAAQRGRALLSLLGMAQIPSADAMGDWLRRMGRGGAGRKLLKRLNAHVLGVTLGDRRTVTLDINATAVLCGKKYATRTYLGVHGYMPMVGHIAETDQVVASDFRRGNRPPSFDNLSFIRRCMRSLPCGV